MESHVPQLNDSRQKASATRFIRQMVIRGNRVLNMAPDAQRLDVVIAPGQWCGWIDGAHGWSGMKTAVFRRWIKDARVEETRLDSGEITVHVVPTGNQITVAVAGRVTV